MQVRSWVGAKLETTVGKQRTDSLRAIEHRVRSRLAPPPPPPPARLPSLTQLARKHGTDKWGTHRYTPHYQASLKHLRHDHFTLLEIGVGGFINTSRGGESLRMWKEFFPNATIVGLDIVDKTEFAEERIHIYQGDQSDPEFLKDVVARHPDLKVVVDDGSHVPAHVRASFEILFPMLPDDGIYCMEDLQTSYWPDWGGEIDPKAPGTSMALVKDLIDGLNHVEFLVEGYEPTYSDQNVVAVHAWHNMVVVEKGPNNEGTNKPRAHNRPYGAVPTD